MAEIFKNALAKDIGTSAVTLYSTVTGPTPLKSILVELDVANLLPSAVTFSIWIERAGNSYHIIKDAPISPGSTVKVIAGQKIVLDGSQGDVVKVSASAATAITAIMSLIEGIGA